MLNFKWHIRDIREFLHLVIYFVLLDFGVTRLVSSIIRSDYKNLLRAEMEQSYPAIKQAECNMGYFDTNMTLEC
ncbi:hypothetical protein [Pseudoalteromonas piscicida]|uniref:hypothetical protein n=1 Tax=Pseudoalteromonas piscicida TaxID=43662 RepID=UPI0005F9EA92|nr:hypothetical protein [Pseudoalteromonas piscicida]KJZ01549.1 hypothetical protein TW73_14120 [Pseudoalteromonas piscicida]